MEKSKPERQLYDNEYVYLVNWRECNAFMENGCDIIALVLSPADGIGLPPVDKLPSDCDPNNRKMLERLYSNFGGDPDPSKRKQHRVPQDHDRYTDVATIPVQNGCYFVEEYTHTADSESFGVYLHRRNTGQRPAGR